MADLPWYKYFPTAFESDTALLSNMSVGGWQRLLNYMIPKKIDTIEGNWSFFSRLLRCQKNEAIEIIEELQQQEICEINIDNGKGVTPLITLMSRRIKKENTTRENNKIRKQKQRSHADVTLKSTPLSAIDVRSYMLDVRKEDIKKTKILEKNNIKQPIANNTTKTEKTKNPIYDKLKEVFLKLNYPLLQTDQTSCSKIFTKQILLGLSNENMILQLDNFIKKNKITFTDKTHLFNSLFKWLDNVKE
jgi:hypothetical protein